MGVLVERCRYLEEAACASICGGCGPEAFKVGCLLDVAQHPHLVSCRRHHSTRSQLKRPGCAACLRAGAVNSCKVPTQEFFARDMGLPLTMTPNYDDFSCQ